MDDDDTPSIHSVRHLIDADARAERWGCSASYAAGREAGMREAAKKARGHIEFYFPDVPRAGEACEAAILSAIGTQEDSTSE